MMGRVCIGLSGVLLSGMVLLAASGCATGSVRLSLTPDMDRVWPLPPDPPRVAYLHQVRTPADAGVVKGLWSRIRAAIAGVEQPPEIENPVGVYADEDGWTLVADTGLQVVHILNLKAATYAQAYLLPRERRLASPVGVALDPKRGRVFVSDSILNQIFVYDLQGYYVGVFGNGLLRPSGMVWDASSDELIVVDTGHHRVVRYRADGTQSAVVGERGTAPGQFNYPTHVAVDRSGQYYVTDTLNFRVQVFAADGTPVRQVGQVGDRLGSFSKPKGVAVSPDGAILFVVDGLFDVVQMFDHRGRLLMVFGGSGSSPGHMWLPAGIAVAGDTVFVADTQNQRMQMFRLLDTRPVPEA